jgi:Nucleotidyl transferase AbiEii toxin, Type IV TA system
VTKKKVSNIAASVHAKLLALAKERREDFNLVLVRYGLERLLYRIGQSSHAGAFMLKGAMLFATWSGHVHRQTKDLDLRGSGSPDLEHIAEVFREIVAVEVEDDGLVLDPRGVVADRIKDGEEYEGARVTIAAKLGDARLALQVDVGFGDAVNPEPTTIDFPTLLPLPAPRILAYPKETVISEKLQAMVHLGLANSRMKDFFDICYLAGAFEFNGDVLREAVIATFARRGTAMPDGLPLALTETFFADAQKRQQWTAFINRSGVADKSLALDQVVRALAEFLGPVIEAASAGSNIPARWRAGGPWVPGSNGDAASEDRADPLGTVQDLLDPLPH